MCPQYYRINNRSDLDNIGLSALASTNITKQTCKRVLHGTLQYSGVLRTHQLAFSASRISDSLSDSPQYAAMCRMLAVAIELGPSFMDSVGRSINRPQFELLYCDQRELHNASPSTISIELSCFTLQWPVVPLVMTTTCYPAVITGALGPTFN